MRIHSPHESIFYLPGTFFTPLFPQAPRKPLTGSIPVDGISKVLYSLEEMIGALGKFNRRFPLSKSEEPVHSGFNQLKGRGPSCVGRNIIRQNFNKLSTNSKRGN